MKNIFIWTILIIFLGGILTFYIKNIKDIKNNNSIDYTVAVNNDINDINDKFPSWLKSENSEISFKYPEKLDTNYINTVDWPPIFKIEDKAYSCLENDNNSTLEGGKTSKEIIGGKEFCINRQDEGAAGSVYSNYIYTFLYQNKTITATFSLRAPQCMNYDEPKQSECINEENSFNISSLILNIISTIKLNN